MHDRRLSIVRRSPQSMEVNDPVIFNGVGLNCEAKCRKVESTLEDVVCELLWGAVTIPPPFSHKGAIYFIQ